MLSFTEFINEGKGFELGGKKYSSGFGRYTCDGKSISKEEYMKASTQYKNTKKSLVQNSEPTKLTTFKNDLNKISTESYKMSTDTINKYNKIKEFIPMNSQTRNKLEDLVGTIKDNMSWMRQFKSDSENIEKILSNNMDKSSEFYKKIEAIDNDISKGCEIYLNKMEKRRNGLFIEIKQCKYEFDIIYKKYEHLV
jgi:hypothetical protein